MPEDVRSMEGLGVSVAGVVVAAREHGELRLDADSGSGVDGKLTIGSPQPGFYKCQGFSSFDDASFASALT